MTLDTYISLGVMSSADLARKTGLSAASITRIIQGKQKPSFAAIKSIVEATGGKVSADDLIFATPTSEARA